MEHNLETCGTYSQATCDYLFRDDSTPMEECKSLKTEYDKCFNTWFKNKYLKGSDDDSMCSELLTNYTGCVKKAMKEKDININELIQYHSQYTKSKIPPPKNN